MLPQCRCGDPNCPVCGPAGGCPICSPGPCVGHAVGFHWGSAQPEPEPEAPLFTECVIGYRHWRLDDWVLRPRLIGPPWRPGVNTAICDKQSAYALGIGAVIDPRPHRAPGACCDCGLYALHEPVSWGDPDGPAVFGAVAAWGDLRVHWQGFRAEKARIVALAYTLDMPLGLRRQIFKAAGVYGCEYVPMHRLAEVAAKYGTPLPENARPERVPPVDFAVGGAWRRSPPTLMPVATGIIGHPARQTVPPPQGTGIVTSPPRRGIRALRRYAKQQSRLGDQASGAGDHAMAILRYDAAADAFGRLARIYSRGAWLVAMAAGSLVVSVVATLMGWL